MAPLLAAWREAGTTPVVGYEVPFYTDHFDAVELARRSSLTQVEGASFSAACDMPSVVFIDVPPMLAPAAATTMVERCEQALGTGRCRRSGKAATENAGGSYYAVLESDDRELRTATIELHRASAEGEVVAHRNLVFTGENAPETRWASIGLVVAGLVAARDANAAPAHAEAAAPRVPRPPPDARTRANEPRLWGADVGGVIGPGLAQGPYRFGGFGRFWHRVESAPHAILLGSMRYSALSGAPSARWLSVGAGLGVRVGGPQLPVHLDITGELIAERMAVTARLATAATTDSASQARFGGRISLSLGFALTSFAGLALGVDATGLTPPVSIEVQNQVVGREPSGRVALLAGLRVAP